MRPSRCSWKMTSRKRWATRSAARGRLSAWLRSPYSVSMPTIRSNTAAPKGLARKVAIWSPFRNAPDARRRENRTAAYWVVREDRKRSGNAAGGHSWTGSPVSARSRAKPRHEHLRDLGGGEPAVLGGSGRAAIKDRHVDATIPAASLQVLRQAPVVGGRRFGGRLEKISDRPRAERSGQRRGQRRVLPRSGRVEMRDDRLARGIRGRERRAPGGLFEGTVVVQSHEHVLSHPRAHLNE